MNVRNKALKNIQWKLFLATVIVLSFSIMILSMEQYPIFKEHRQLRSNYESQNIPEDKTNKATNVNGSETNYWNKTTNEVHSCRSLTFTTEPLPVTALASFPGSGNTWTRHLIEQTTGFYTGSIYNDKSLRPVFKGEGEIESVIAVKTHYPVFKTAKINPTKVVLVIRRIFDAIKSWENFARTKSHTRKVHPRTMIYNKRQWNRNILKKAEQYAKFHRYWLQEHSAEVLVVFYEDLKHNLTQQLKRMSDFLNVPVSNDILQCVVQNSEGKYHRETTQKAKDILFEALTTDTKAQLDNVYNEVLRQAEH